jgi:hypothetical protein
LLPKQSSGTDTMDLGDQQPAKEKNSWQENSKDQERE